MTYASITLPYNPKQFETEPSPKSKQALKGRVTSALKNAGSAVKNGIKNHGQTMETLSKYVAATKDTITNKFSGIALAQLLANGNVSNKDALNYLFLGFAPAMDQQAIAMGYTGANQMKDAIANGTINVGSFISGFTNTLKGITDLEKQLNSKATLNQNNIIELDITLNHNEEYQSETPDRRVESGVSYAEVLNNLPEIFYIDCGLQDGKLYSVSEFKGLLTYLRQRKVPFKMTIGEEQINNLVLQNFRPSVLGSRSGLDYTLEVKKVRIGSIELEPVNIQPIPNVYGETTGEGSGQQKFDTKVPYAVSNPAMPNIHLGSMVQGGAMSTNILRLGGIKFRRLPGQKYVEDNL